MNDRVVFDCMVFLQAASKPSRLHGLFEAARAGRLTLFVSPDILAEVHDVLLRPKIQRQFPALTKPAVLAFLTDVLSFSIYITDVQAVFAYPRDPKDEKYLNLAIAISAKYIASADKDLLDLMDTTTTAGKDFRLRFPGIEIMAPGALMRILETERSQDN